MNRTKIEWTDYTWNPVTGCKRGCYYCYARKMAHRLRGKHGYPEDDPFKPTFHEDRLREPYKVKKPAKIFTCSMGELFGPWIPREWVLKILEVIKENPHHTFQILTKYPSGADYLFPDNIWLGYTITDFYDLFWYDLKDFENTKAKNHFISFEPLLGEIPTDSLNGNIDWIIIGAQTNPYKPPKKEWVLLLLGRAKQLGIPVFMKNNLKPLFSFPKFELCQEFPKEVAK